MLQNNTRLANLYYDSARVHLEAKIAVSQQDSRYHSSLGIAYAGLGKKNKAMKLRANHTNLFCTIKKL